jgi:hypothetical protein
MLSGQSKSRLFGRLPRKVMTDRNVHIKAGFYTLAQFSIVFLTYHGIMTLFEDKKDNK